MTTYLNNIRNTAIHEAAHAVIARVLGIPCGSVSIIPNEKEGEAGHHKMDDPFLTECHWDQIGKVYRRETPFRVRIIAYMAGAEAEKVILGKCEGGDDDDWDQIELTVKRRDALCWSVAEWERREPRMRQRTRALIREHRAKIERVAAALLKRKKLSAGEIDALMK